VVMTDGSTQAAILNVRDLYVLFLSYSSSTILLLFYFVYVLLSLFYNGLLTYSLFFSIVLCCFVN
jgi:hypothetical protein